MERQHKKPASNTAASSPDSSGSSSSSRSIHGSMSSAFLGVSSSTHCQSQRRSSPSLYPPPAPTLLPGLLASRGSAASGGSPSGSSSSQFHQISPSPGTAAKRQPRPSSRLTHSLPSPFLSELSAIRRIGTNLFGDLKAQEMTQRPEKEMTQSSLSLTMPQTHHHTPIPIGDISGFPSASKQQQPLTMRGLPGFAPPPLQQQQAQSSLSSLQPLPVGNFSGFPLPALQPQQMQPSSSTDLPSRIFSGLEPLPVVSQHFSTYAAPLPSRTTIFQSSSSCSADHVSLPNPLHGKPTNLEGRGSGSGLSMRADAEGVDVGRQTLETMLTPASVHDKVNNAGGSSRSSSINWNCHGSTPMSSRSQEQALQQLRHLLSVWSSTVSSSCSAGPQTPWNYSSLSMENSTPIPAIPKLILGGKDRPGLPPQSQALGAGASSMSRRGCTKEHFFSEADIEKINKENQLKELVKTDPKRVRRILRNREHVARLKVQKASHLQDLQRQADALKMECMSLFAQVQSHQEMFDNLKTEIRKLKIKLKGLNEQTNLSQALNDQLQSEIERFKLL